jgi:FkbM family methyltransferase
MFNNCDSNTNGERFLYNKIKPYINIIFDVGCKEDSMFIDFEKEVHYFDPVYEYIHRLSNQVINNKSSYFNNFGLSNENNDIYYYPKYESFNNRVNSCKISDDSNKIILKVKSAKDYIVEKKILSIDFLKIDTEGYELNVLKGFDDYLFNVKIIQFEYGGTFIDNNLKLIDVIQYLERYKFHKFSYLTQSGPIIINDFTDHYQYCNIVCINKNSDITYLLYNIY